MTRTGSSETKSSYEGASTCMFGVKKREIDSPERKTKANSYIQVTLHYTKPKQKQRESHKNASPLCLCVCVGCITPSLH